MMVTTSKHQGQVLRIQAKAPSGYIPLPEPIRIVEHEWPDGTRPAVSICCITYNHESFIRDAIEGFLMQETTFPVEILIHDDASTDATASIIREYERIYPQLIKPVYQAENTYSRGGRPGHATRERATGTYIAICEGDDYWTDSRKLQIQVDFLDRNSEFVVCGHDVFIVDEKGNRISDFKMLKCGMRDHSAEELILGAGNLPTMSLVYRNVIGQHPPEMRHVKNGDTFLLSLFGQFGKSKYHSDIEPGAYRRHVGGVWSQLSHLEMRDSRINTFFWMYRYYLRIGNLKASSHYWDRMAAMVVNEFTILQLVSSLLLALRKRLRIRSRFGQLFCPGGRKG